MRTGCKTLMHKFLTTPAQMYNVGSDGCIARSSIFEAATLDVFGMHYPNYRRHSIRHTNGPCERSPIQSGNLPIDSFNLSPSLPVLSELRNSQSSLHSISSPDRSQSSKRVCATQIHWTRYYLHVQHCLPLS